MYFSDKYECMPEGGFTSFIKDLLDHDNIEYINNEDALKYISLNDQDHRIEFHGLEVSTNCKLVYTGAIDELFNYEFGKLPYRSLTFKYETLNEELFQATPVVAYPQVEGYTRITEYKQLPKQNILRKVKRMNHIILFQQMIQLCFILNTKQKLGIMII